MKAREKIETQLEHLKAELNHQMQENRLLLNENLRLIELDRLRAKFIADAAHELRNPITNLNLRVYLLERASPERRAHYLAEFKQQLAHIAELCEDILLISRLDSLDTPLRLEPVNLNTIAEEVVIAYRPMAESSGISLIAEYEPDLPPILGERRQLYRAGSNLVSNAIHYTPTGRVRVATTLDVTARRACLEIEDSGMGIAPQDMPHIFERFYRGDHRHIPGNGLGLSIVKEIVDVHSGTIEVQSRPGEGARFKICFPLSAAVNA